MALTQTQIVAQLAEDTELTKAEIKNVLVALENLVLSEIGNAEKFKIGTLVQLDVKLKPATKARKGTNPFTGEEMMFKAKPARNVVKVLALKSLKDMV